MAVIRAIWRLLGLFGAITLFRVPRLLRHEVAVIRVIRAITLFRVPRLLRHQVINRIFTLITQISSRFTIIIIPVILHFPIDSQLLP
jgi:hypothetical protein